VTNDCVLANHEMPCYGLACQPTCKQAKNFDLPLRDSITVL
jgi:hypothetical protein